MRRHVRPVCAILVVVLLQLLLVESGYACLATGTTPTGGDAMAGMAMPATGRGDTGPAEQRSHAPCRFPWAPNGCQTMGPCAPAVLVVQTAVLPLPDSPRLTPVTCEPLEHLSESLAPELPPPRA
ncbi:hypothetical protein BH09GEM1_BH09GEM1_11370 [soil metagenome]